MIPLVAELHLFLCLGALGLLAHEDWTCFEIAPQWVLMGLANGAAVLIAQYTGPDEILMGAATWFLGALSIKFGARLAGRTHSLGQGDIGLIMLCGAVFTSENSALGITMVVICYVVFYAYFSKARGKRLFRGHCPLGPPAALAMALYLILPFTLLPNARPETAPNGYEALVAIMALVCTVVALVWKGIEHRKDLQHGM
jgi:hypothetical protein